ncbi:MAG: NIPSNAP family protein [Dehalococcoidia bacterium]|tara:strand:+ start:4658 stop:5272 length:615 start_codon:yes stop_codon:yes gene_type:complete
MLYEVRSYILKAGATPHFEEEFEKALPEREKFSKLGAFWHTEIGPLNQVIHVWPYKDIEERSRIRAEAVAAGVWPPKVEPGTIINMQSEIFIPAPFMRPLGGDQALGNVYEMRTYTYQPGAMPEVVKRWGERIEEREKASPLVAGMYSDIGGLNKWVHIWAYDDLNHRAEVRSNRGENWPPPTREFIVSQENKIMLPSSFSPMH